MSEEVKRGRPPKKGKVSWKPASITEIADKDPNFRYRWVNKHPDNLAKKQAEGWEYDNQATSEETRVEHGKSLTGTREKHDVVLMRMPEELAQSRDEFISDKTERRTAGLTAHLKKDLEKDGAQMHGEITISSRTRTQNLN